jgi:hypothetical protein
VTAVYKPSAEHRALVENASAFGLTQSQIAAQLYPAEAIVNWSEYFKDLYVLDESKLRREGFAWVPHRRFRVLQLTNGVYEQAIFEYGPQVKASHS